MSSLSSFFAESIGINQGPLGLVNISNLTDPINSNIPLSSLDIKTCNYYIISSLNNINIILPEISQSNIKIGYNTTIINDGNTILSIYNFNNVLIHQLIPKKSIKLIATNLAQNWIFSSIILSNSISSGINLLEPVISNYEYFLKNLISSDSTITITDNTNQIDLVSNIPNIPAQPILDIYISISGSDANDGLTPGTAVLNLSRAFEISNKLGWNHEVYFNFGPGNHILPEDESYVFKETANGSNKGAYVFRGNTLNLVSSFTVNTSTTLSPTSMVSISTTVPMSTGAYNGLVILMTSGINVGKYYQVAENTISDIYLLTTDSINPGDTFEIYSNTTSITIRGNRFSDGYIVISNIDFILQDKTIPTPDEDILQFIDDIIIFDNCRILTDPTIQYPFILFYESTVLSSINAGIFTDLYVSQNLGLVYDGSNLPNPGDYIQVNFINSFMSYQQIYHDKTVINAQNSNGYLFLHYYKNCTELNYFATTLYCGNVILRDCNSSNGTIQSQNNSSVTIDNMLVSGNTDCLLRVQGLSNLNIINVDVTLLNVIGNVEQFSALYLVNCNILSMIGTNGNRDFNNSTVAFINTNITSPIQLINFRCCHCVIFNNVNIIGDLQMIFYGSNISMDNYSSYSTNTIEFQNSRIMANNINFHSTNITNKMLLNQSIFMCQNFNTSEVLGGGRVIDAINSTITIQNFGLIDQGLYPDLNMNFSNTTLHIENFNINLQTPFIFSALMSKLSFGNIVFNSNNFSTQFNYDNCNVYIRSLNHDGAINGSNYFNLLRESMLNIRECNFNNCPELFCNINSGSSYYSELGNFNNSGQLFLCNDNFNTIQLENYNCNNMSTSANNYIRLRNGKLYTDNFQFNTSVPNGDYLIYLENCKATCNNTNLSSDDGGGFNLLRHSDLVYTNSFMIVIGIISVYNGINCSESTVYLNNLDIQNFRNGITLINKSSGYIGNIISNISNIIYGIDLKSGSSFVNALNNTISGSSDDVNIGALGTRTWVQIDAGLLADTNDYSTATPQYVYISPAN